MLINNPQLRRMRLATLLVPPPLPCNRGKTTAVHPHLLDELIFGGHVVVAIISTATETKPMWIGVFVTREYRCEQILWKKKTIRHYPLKVYRSNFAHMTRN